MRFVLQISPYLFGFFVVVSFLGGLVLFYLFSLIRLGRMRDCIADFSPFYSVLKVDI